jgi:hypothetical protein
MSASRAMESAIDAALDRHFKATTKLTVPADGATYEIEKAFGRRQAWYEELATGRFLATAGGSGVLYRETIVDGLLKEIGVAFSAKLKCGVIVNGPHGVGKSHSLVNLVLKLQASGDYLVTFVPDCQQWEGATYLLRMICDSFGTTLEDVKPPKVAEAHGDYFLEQFNSIVGAIANKLAEREKKWVFVFDQINKLFPKTGKSTISGFQFPYNMISKIRKPGHVISILSASANNEIADTGTEEGFLEFPHPIEMTDDELMAVFTEDYRKAEKSASGHPYYVRLFLDMGELAFLEKVYMDVRTSLVKLEEDHPANWPLVLEAVIFCVLGLRRSMAYPYDKKFIVPVDSSGRVHFIPVFPAVLDAYRAFYWNDIMKHVEEQETMYLTVCSISETTADTRGRLFEAIAIQRIKSRGLILRDALGRQGQEVEVKVQVKQGVFSRFPGSALPNIADVIDDTLYVPDSCNFPAIDFFARTGSTLVAFQVHVSKHKDVVSTLLGMCRSAGWFNDKSNIVALIYLSPNAKSKEHSARLVLPGTADCMGTRGSDGGTIYLGSRTCANFPDTLNIAWPERAT